MPVDPAATRRFIESLSTHLEDHLATWKSSLVDARRDIETLLNSISEKIPAHATPLFPEDIVTLMLEDAVLAGAAGEKAERPSVPGGGAAPDWSLVRGSLAAIESARTQVDVLTRFLSQAHAHASRVALLVLRNDRLTGWKSLGWDASGGRDESVKTIDLGADEDSFVAEVLRAQRSMAAEPPDEGGPLRKSLAGRPPSRTLLVPMVIRDRLAGIVCAEELPGEDGRLNEAAIEVLTFVTGLAVDLLAARKRIPSPSLTPTGEAIPRWKAGAAASAPAARPIPSTIFELESGSRPIAAAPRAAAAPPSGAEPVEGPRPRPTDAAAALRALEDSAAGKKRAPEGPPRPPMAPAPTKAPGADTAFIPIVPAAPVSPLGAPRGASIPPPLAQATTGDFTKAFEALKTSGPITRTVLPPPTAPGVETTVPKPRPSTVVPPLTSQVRPISGFIPRSRAGAAADSPQRALDDAKRLARLLISEIKLYNEKKVEEGRAANDLYARLKDDIERSRQVYEERTPESIRKGTNLFQEELVRILADGRAEALGPK